MICGRVAHVHGQVRHELLAADPEAHVRVLARGRRGAPVAQVEPGAEALARTREHRDLALGVGADGVERVVQLGGQAERQRVEPVGPVQRDETDVRLDRLDGDIGHVSTRPWSHGPQFDGHHFDALDPRISGEVRVLGEHVERLRDLGHRRTVLVRRWAGARRGRSRRAWPRFPARTVCSSAGSASWNTCRRCSRVNGPVPSSCG